MNCSQCGRTIYSCTTVNGLIVCDWCSPNKQAMTKPDDAVPKTGAYVPENFERELEAAATEKFIDIDGAYRDKYWRADDFKAGARWGYERGEANRVGKLIDDLDAQLAATKAEIEKRDRTIILMGECASRDLGMLVKQRDELKVEVESAKRAVKRRNKSLIEKNAKIDELKLLAESYRAKLLEFLNVYLPETGHEKMLYDEVCRLLGMYTPEEVDAFLEENSELMDSLAGEPPKKSEN